MTFCVENVAWLHFDLFYLRNFAVGMHNMTLPTFYFRAPFPNYQHVFLDTPLNRKPHSGNIWKKVIVWQKCLKVIMTGSSPHTVTVANQVLVEDSGA